MPDAFETIDSFMRSMEDFNLGYLRTTQAPAAERAVQQLRSLANDLAGAADNTDSVKSTESDEDLWVLVIEHRHGTDVTIHRSEGGARRTLYGFVDQWWTDEMPPGKECPANPHDAIYEYFDHTEESYTLDTGRITD
jgi:hypothetical protein